MNQHNGSLSVDLFWKLLPHKGQSRVLSGKAGTCPLGRAPFTLLFWVDVEGTSTPASLRVLSCCLTSVAIFFKAAFDFSGSTDGV